MPLTIDNNDVAKQIYLKILEQVSFSFVFCCETGVERNMFRFLIVFECIKMNMHVLKILLSNSKKIDFFQLERIST